MSEQYWEQQLQWEQQQRQQRQQQQWQQQQPSHPLSSNLELQQAWLRNGGPSAEVAELASQLLVDRRHQQHYHQQQQQQEQQQQMSAAVDAALATAPPPENREIQYATKLLQAWYPEMQLDEAVWKDLPEFLAQPAILLYQVQAT